jgi:hypothetical protein
VKSGKRDYNSAVIKQHSTKQTASNYYAIFSDGFRYEFKPDHNVFAEFMAHEKARQRHTRVIIVKKVPIQVTPPNKKSLP